MIFSKRLARGRLVALVLLLVAIGRDANWRDVGIDVLGASLGLVFAQAVRDNQNV